MDESWGGGVQVLTSIRTVTDCAHEYCCVDVRRTRTREVDDRDVVPCPHHPAHALSSRTADTRRPSRQHPIARSSQAVPAQVAPVPSYRHRHLCLFLRCLRRPRQEPRDRLS